MKKNDSTLAALMSAAALLPIVTLPILSHAETSAQEPVAAADIGSSFIPVGATMGLRVLSYRESGDRMKVTEPVLWLKTPVFDNWEVAASGTIDIVSGASPEIVSNRSGKPVQILSGASGPITDRRKAGDVSLKRKIGDNTISLSRSMSTEDDYTSHAWGANATFDFNERNTTLAVGYGKSNDRVGSTLVPSLDARRDTHEYLLGLTQILDRYSLVQSNITRTMGSGYYNDPYRLTQSIITNAAGGQSLNLFVDTRPSARPQWAWLTRYKRALAAQQAVVTAEYRYFTDDWGIRSHTLFASWLQTVNETWKIEGGLRYYSQRQADFYRAEITSLPAPQYTSSDQRIAGFGAFEPSLKAIMQLTDAMSIDAGISLYRQQGNWKLGGGTATFQPLQAVLVNVGVIYRF
ncbi:MAG: DUF3570 domain-containing protein [Betaproteobacteria bacterium]